MICFFDIISDVDYKVAVLVTSNVGNCGIGGTLVIVSNIIVAHNILFAPGDVITGTAAAGVANAVTVIFDATLITTAAADTNVAFVVVVLADRITITVIVIKVFTSFK